VNKGEQFDVFYTHPRVLAGVAHVLGRSIKLSSLNYRSAKPYTLSMMATEGSQGNDQCGAFFTGLSKIIIPRVYRKNYMGALRKLMRQRIADCT